MLQYVGKIFSTQVMRQGPGMFSLFSSSASGSDLSFFFSPSHVLHSVYSVLPFGFPTVFVLGTSIK